MGFGLTLIRFSLEVKLQPMALADPFTAYDFASYADVICASTGRVIIQQDMNHLAQLCQ